MRFQTSLHKIRASEKEREGGSTLDLWITCGKKYMSPKIKLCKEQGCFNQATTAGFCRFHYLKNWKKLRVERQKKASKNLNRYIDNILRNDPDQALAKLKYDIRSEISFDASDDKGYYKDAVREAIEDLGLREDLDHMIDSIKIDEGF